MSRLHFLKPGFLLGTNIKMHDLMQKLNFRAAIGGCLIFDKAVKRNRTCRTRRTRRTVLSVMIQVYKPTMSTLWTFGSLIFRFMIKKFDFFHDPLLLNFRP